MGNGKLSEMAGLAEDIFTHISSSQSLSDKDRAILVAGVEGYVAAHDTFCVAG